MQKSIQSQAISHIGALFLSKAVLLAIEANPANGSQRLSAKFSILQFSVVYDLHNISKSIQNYGCPRASCVAVYYLTPFWVLLFCWYNILDKKAVKELYERR